MYFNYLNEKKIIHLISLSCPGHVWNALFCLELFNFRVYEFKTKVYYECIS